MYDVNTLASLEFFSLGIGSQSSLFRPLASLEMSGGPDSVCRPSLRLRQLKDQPYNKAPRFARGNLLTNF